MIDAPGLPRAMNLQSIAQAGGPVALPDPDDPAIACDGRSCQTDRMADENDQSREGASGNASGPDDALPATVREKNGWTIVSLNEPSLMNPAVVEALGEGIESLVERGRKRIILDFSEVEYISSSMIGVLMGARQCVSEAGGTFVLCSLNDRLLELLRITRLHKMFIVEPSLQDAMKRVGHP